MTALYACGTCGHPFYEHRESREWQLLNPRRRRGLVGCAHSDCQCMSANDNHVAAAQSVPARPRP